MRLLLRLLSLLALGMLAACAPAAAPTPTIPPAESGSGAPTPLRMDGLYAEPDLSLVANTGRPQFLNSYANW